MLERMMRELLDQAGVTIGGPNPWDIQIQDSRVFRRVFSQKTLGFGEAFMDGWWDCAQPDALLTRLLLADAYNRAGDGWGRRLQNLLFRIGNMQSKARALMVAEKHYNLDNDLFFRFLDPYRQYSCAYFRDTDDLGQAQLNKLDLISRKLEIEHGDHVLDIGSGWGGLAKYVSEHYGCRVTGVNISREQRHAATSFCEGLPVTFVGCDYRDIEGHFSKVVSVGMFEHVGWKNYRVYFETVARCLEADGLFLLHTIGANRTRHGQNDPWLDKYIFPNATIPSIRQISLALEGLFVVEDWHNIGPHYDRTLMAWHAAFERAWPALRERYDERFRRMWRYYLLSCAAAFRARETQCWQVVLSRANTGRKQPARQT